MTETQNEDTAVRNGNNDTSELSSQLSPSQSAREVEDEIDEEHRNNPLFRSDAFDQIPSQNKQLSQNTYGQQRIPTGDITANTDQNLNENFKNDTTYGQDKS